MPPSDPSHTPARRESPQPPPNELTEIPSGPENVPAVRPEQQQLAGSSPELERNRRTIISFKSRSSQVGSRRTSAVVNDASTTEPSVQTPFLVVTLVLGVISWFIGFISQAFVTAKFGNPPIATLWFAFILQSLLLAWLLASFISASPRTHLHTSSNTIAHLASMATVLASIGVNNTIFSHVPAQKATAVGWLITAIVDLLWVIYFSAEEGSGIRSFVDGSWGAVGSRRRHPPGGGGDVGLGGEEEADSEEEGERGAAAPVKPKRRGLSFTAKLPPLTPPSFKLKSARLRKPRQENVSELKTVDETAAGNGDTAADLSSEPSGGGGGGGPGDRRRSAAARSTSVNPGASSIGGEVPGDSRPVSSALSGAGGGSASGRGSAGSRVKALALYKYEGSATDPHELTFDKGDIFEIIDRSGKWWEAINKEGKSGIVPSNYMRVVE